MREAQHRGTVVKLAQHLLCLVPLVLAACGQEAVNAAAPRGGPSSKADTPKPASGSESNVSSPAAPSDCSGEWQAPEYACTGTAECIDGERCTTEDGDCLADPCLADGAQCSQDACLGFCFDDALATVELPAWEGTWIGTVTYRDDAGSVEEAEARLEAAGDSVFLEALAGLQAFRLAKDPRKLPGRFVIVDHADTIDAYGFCSAAGCHFRYVREFFAGTTFDLHLRCAGKKLCLDIATVALGVAVEGTLGCLDKQ